MDETWIHYFDPETKTQSMVWKHASLPTPKMFRAVSSAVKVMASNFGASKGTILVDYISEGATITGRYYAEIIRQIREAITVKRRAKLRKGVLLLQPRFSNAHSHTSRVAMDAVSDAGFELLQHPPYSPDLAPCGFYLFFRLKNHIRVEKCECDFEVIKAVCKSMLTGPRLLLTDIISLEHR